MTPSAESACAIEILLVEDNPGDVVLTREGLRSCRISNRIHVVGDGEQALAFLGREGEYRDAPRPDLILLDLNLPRMNGLEVLGVIKNQPELLGIPVVVLSSSSAEEDIVRAFDKHANCFITKPLDLTQLIKVMGAIEDFWFTVVKLPGEQP